MECWSDGVLECWSVGVLECWSVGVLEYCAKSELHPPSGLGMPRGRYLKKGKFVQDLGRTVCAVSPIVGPDDKRRDRDTLDKGHPHSTAQIRRGHTLTDSR